MIKALSTHSNDVEIIFWDCAFHCVKMAQRVHDTANPLFSMVYPVFRRKLFILIALIDAGLVLGLLLGYLRNL